MHKSRIFTGILFGFVAGIAIRSFSGSMLFIWLFLTVSIISCSVFPKNGKAMLFSAAFLSMAIGFLRLDSGLAGLERKAVSPGRFEGEAVVAENPERKDNFKRLVLRTDKDILIQASVSPNSNLSYGDVLDLKCDLEIPENTRSFDYRMNLAKDGIIYLCLKPEIGSTGENRGNRIYSWVLSVKNKMEENVNQSLPEPEAGLANGLILGGSNRLGKEMRENFSRTGMSHIVAVSGYNVTIIAEYLMLLGIVFGLWRRQAFWFAIGGISIFVLMIGFPASAVRAGVMGSLLLWAMKHGRIANSWNAIVFSAAIMLLINPMLLRWDIGFQLSFLATVGIVAFSSFWEKSFIKKHKALGISEIILLSLSAQLLVLPVLAYNFGYLSFVSLLANILILPLVPVSMLLVFLVAVSGFISGTLSVFTGWLAYVPLRFEIGVIEILSGLKWAGMRIENIHWLILLLWYVVLLGFVLFYNKKAINKSSEN